MHELLNNPEVQRLLAPDTGLLFAVWETMYMTVVSTLFAYVIGLPLGVHHHLHLALLLGQ